LKYEIRTKYSLIRKYRFQKNIQTNSIKLIEPKTTKPKEKSRYGLSKDLKINSQQKKKKRKQKEKTNNNLKNKEVSFFKIQFDEINKN